VYRSCKLHIFQPFSSLGGSLSCRSLFFMGMWRMSITHSKMNRALVVPVVCNDDGCSWEETGSLWVTLLFLMFAMMKSGPRKKIVNI
jgi:hypothetical protein